MVARPIAVLAISLAVLASALAALIYDPLGFVSLLAQLQSDAWRHFGGQWGTRPVWAEAAELLFTGVAGIAAISLLIRTRIYWAGLFVLAALAASLYGAWVLAQALGLAFNAVGPGIGLILTFVAGALVRLAQLHTDRRELHFAFADSLPRATIDKIARTPSLLSLDGETRNVTYLVCGVRGLAELSASFREDPQGFTRLMQQVLTPLMEQALLQGGAIDRMTADGFAAFWNAPLEDCDHALHACEAANGMAVMAARVNEQLARPRTASPVEIGIGIATGKVIAGGFGGHRRLGYSVNGEAVQQAARVQALSQDYGPAVIVTEETRKEATRGFAFLEVDYVTQGMSDPPLRLYAMLGNPMVKASPKFRALITFHEHIFQSLRSRQWEKARVLIGQCRKLSGASQTLYDLHLSRIRYFETNPPGPDWDGAFRPILK